MLRGTDLPDLFTTRIRSGKALPKDNPSFLTLFLLDVNLKTNKLRKYGAIFWGNDYCMSLACCHAWFQYVLAGRNLAPVEGRILNCNWCNIEPG